MSLFQKADMGHSHLKAGIMGLAGSGKTYTASSVAIGLVGYMRQREQKTHNVVAFIDTENGAAWVQPRFKEAGIELMVARTRALSDLRDGIRWAASNADALIIDSITHFWTIFCDEYATRKNRKRGLEFSDWRAVKQDWRENFTDLYLNSPLHILMCGRQGYEYDMQVNDAGKKELVKTGVKMKAEGETGFEPSLLMQMEQEQTLKDGSVQAIDRLCYVLKDRSTFLDGKILKNPTFKDFLPHIKTLNIGGTGPQIDTSRDNSELITEDGDTAWKARETQREIALEEIQAEIDRMFPGQSADMKAQRGDYVEEVFGTRSKTAIERKSLQELQDARNKIWLKSRGHAYGVQPELTRADDIPMGDEKKENAA